MPNYDFKCCDIIEQHLVPVSGESPLCGLCGSPMTKLFTPTANICIPYHMTANADWDTVRAKHNHEADKLVSTGMARKAGRDELTENPMRNLQTTKRATRNYKNKEKLKNKFDRADETYENKMRGKNQ